MSQAHKVTRQALQRILQPLARFCLAHGLSAPELHELMKRAFVHEARRQMQRDKARPTKSRVALMSGLTRPEVGRHWELAADQADAAVQARVNYGQRIVAAWLRDPDFCSKPGKPRALPLEGPTGFEELVRRHGANMPVKAALDELVERGVARLHDDRLALQRHSFVPQDVSPESLVLMGVDGAALLGTLEHNLRGEDTPLFERKVSFRHLKPSGVELLKRRAEQRGQPLLEKLDAELAPHASDEDDPEAVHAGLGIFVYVEDPPQDN